VNAKEKGKGPSRVIGRKSIVEMSASYSCLILISY
jgi:hypothetical protein